MEPATFALSVAFLGVLLGTATCTSDASSNVRDAAAGEGGVGGVGGGTGGSGAGGASGAGGHFGTGGGAAGTSGVRGAATGGGAGGVGGNASGGAAGHGAGGGATGGAGGNFGQSFSCGSSTCSVGGSYCYSYIGGVVGSTESYSCSTIPAACAANPSCACLCPPSSNQVIGCVPLSGGNGAYCSCGDSGGSVRLSCAGD